MAEVEEAGVEDLDDDKWLYGDDIDGTTPEQSDEVVAELLAGNDGVREGTPDLDEIEAASQLPRESTSSVPELQLKTLQQQKDTSPQANESAEVDNENGGVAKGEGEEGSEEEDDDEDDVQITIGTILNPTAAYARPGFGRMPQLPVTGGESVAQVKKVDLDVVPQINGVPLPEVDIDDSILDKPWRKPGADITDYFNYGFSEETWRLYCEKQRKMRSEVNQLNKLVVTTATMMPSMGTPVNKNMFGFPMMDMMPHQTMITPNSSLVPIGVDQNIQIDTMEENEGEGAEEKGTPPPDIGVLPPKLPILPPPGLHPPSLPFPPPQDVSAAAAMAAMFAGGPPPPIRPPDFHGFPPPMHFPPPMPGDMRPPFLPPGFGMGGEPPRGLDDPRAAGLFNPEMGFPPHFLDPSMAGHPDMMDFPPTGNFGRNSRSPSRSSSNSSRGSSMERRHSSRRDKGRDKYDRSSHHRSSTRRSRSRDRSSHHRSSRRDHRDHRDRHSDRHDRDRRERRRRDDRRHERSSKRHRSRSHDDDDDDRDKKRSRSRSAS